jgi:hypothetical protein
MPHETAFQIHVAGALTHRMSGWFEGVAVERGSDGNDVLLTPPIDQAALRGLLSALFNLNVPVIAVIPRAGGGESLKTVRESAEYPREAEER